MVQPEIIQLLDALMIPAFILLIQLVLQSMQLVKAAIVSHSAHRSNRPKADGQNIHAAGNQVIGCRPFEQSGKQDIEALCLPPGSGALQICLIAGRILLHQFQLFQQRFGQRKLPGDIDILAAFYIQFHCFAPFLWPG